MASPAEMGGAGGRRSREKSNFSVTCGLLSQYLKEKGSLRDLGLGMTAARPAPQAKPETLRTMNLLPGAAAAKVASACDNHQHHQDPAEKDAVPDRKNPMGLFPQRVGFRSSSAAPAGTEDARKKAADVRELQTAAQMTIFYGGKVIVFDNFPAEKAKELMMMAGRGNPTSSPPAAVEPQGPPAVAPPPPPPTQPNTATFISKSDAPKPVMAPPAVAQNRPQRGPPPASSDLPIARKVSLHRFLEKRKDRISSKAPYQVHGNDYSSPESAPAAGSSLPAKPEESRHWLGLAPVASKPEGGKQR